MLYLLFESLVLDFESKEASESCLKGVATNSREFVLYLLIERSCNELKRVRALAPHLTKGEELKRTQEIVRALMSHLTKGEELQRTQESPCSSISFS